MTCRLRWRENLVGLGGFKTLPLALELEGGGGGGDGWRERVWQQGLVNIVAAPD
jgi:hypothetical protein